MHVSTSANILRCRHSYNSAIFLENQFQPTGYFNLASMILSSHEHYVLHDLEKISNSHEHYVIHDLEVTPPLKNAESPFSSFPLILVSIKGKDIFPSINNLNEAL